MRKLTSLLFLGGFVFLLMSLTHLLPFGDPPMRIGAGIIHQAADQVGTANFVTAVVLAYRGMDTLGELSILFAAATAGGLVLGHAQRASRQANAGFILRAGTDLMFPLLIVAGLYIVMHGHLTPGGGFQGGVILAAAFFLPILARPGQSLDQRWIGLVEALAGAGFILLGAVALLYGKPFLTPFLGKGTMGQLVSGGSLPLLYMLVGLKVGAELAGLLARLAQDEGEAN